MGKKTFIAAMILTLFLASLVVEAITVNAQSGTQFSGIISQDTIWTKANSPYNLAGDIQVATGVTLTIEAGTTINLNSYNIEVDGTFYARGTSVNQIAFNGNPQFSYAADKITFTKTSTDWNEQKSSGCIIENAVLNQTHIEINNSMKLNNATVTFPDSSSGLRTIYIPVGSPTISNNTILPGGNQALFSGGSAMIVNNTIIGGFNFGIELEGVFNFGLNTGTVTVSNNNITDVYGVNIAIDNGCSGTIIIERNFVEGVIYVGLQSGGNPPFQAIIQNNTILTGMYLQSNATIIYNNILHNNTSYSIYNKDGRVNASYNWWGTIDPNAIEQSIINEYTVSNVNYTPFLTSPNLQAPLIPANIAYPSPSSSTASPSPTLTPSPSVPEFPTWIILPLALIATLPIFAYFKRVKKKK